MRFLKHAPVLVGLLMPFISFGQSDSFDFESFEDFLNVEVVSASKSKDKIQTAPATIFVIKKEEIRTKGWKNLSEVLEFLPGVEIQRKSQAEVLHNYTVRGITGVEKFIIMVNGIRVNSATGTPHQVDYNFSIVNAKQVEVILGPGSALYGADAFAGVINIILDDYEGQQNISANIEYGSFNSHNANFQVLTGNDELSFQLIGSNYHSDEPFFPDFYEEEFEWYTNEYSQNGNIGIPFDPNVVFPVDQQTYSTPTNASNLIGQLKYKSFEIGHSLNYQSTNTSFGMNPRYGIYSENARRDISINTSWAKHSIEKEKWVLNSSLFFQDMTLLPPSAFVNFFSGYENGYKYSKDQVLRLEETFIYTIDDNNEIIIGATAEKDYALANTSDLPTQYDPSKSVSEQSEYYLGSNVNDKFGNDLSIAQDFFETKYNNFSAYAQYKSSFKDIYHLTLGARLDNNSRYGATFNPRAGLVVAPSKKIQAKYLYGSAYLAPSPFKTFKHYGSFILNSDSTGLESGFFHLANPDLKPERMQSHEVIFNIIPHPNFQISVNGFYNQINDLIVPELFFGETFHDVPVGAVERNENKGFSETMGGSITAFGFINLDSKSRITPKLSYSLIDGHIDGESLLYTAKHTVKSSVDFTRGKLSSALTHIYRDKSAALIGGSIFQNQAYSIFNLAVNYNLLEKKSYTLGINTKINNLLNHKFYHLPKDNDLITMTNIPQDPIRFNFGMVLSLL